MSQTRKSIELKRREIIPQKTLSIHAGKGGYEFFEFLVKTEGKEEHSIFFNIAVVQPAGRRDLDIHFFVADHDNFVKWVANSPNTAFIIAPRFIFGQLEFRPPTSGRYYAVLDNQYSVVTPKTVDFGSYETWLEEKMIKTAEQPPKKKVVTGIEHSLLRRIYNKLRYSNTLGLIALLLVVQIACFLIAGLVMVLFNLTFGLEYKDTMGYMATSVGGSTIVILFAIYRFRTGKALTASAL